MKNISILIFVTFTNINCVSQLDIKIMPLNQITEKFYNDLEQYSKINGNKIKRASYIDSVAFSRLSYFSELLKENGKEYDLFELTDSIPKNHSGHSRFFNKPNTFKEPYGIVYPEPLPALHHKNKKVCGEIMQQTCWKKSSEILYSKEKLIEMASKAFNNQLGSDYILNGYKLSKSHKKVIDEYGLGLVGTATVAIISIKKSKNETKWHYEVIFYNLTVFSKNLYDS